MQKHKVLPERLRRTYPNLPTRTPVVQPPRRSATLPYILSATTQTPLPHPHHAADPKQQQQQLQENLLQDGLLPPHGPNGTGLVLNRSPQKISEEVPPELPPRPVLLSRSSPKLPEKIPPELPPRPLGSRKAVSKILHDKSPSKMSRSDNDTNASPKHRSDLQSSRKNLSTIPLKVTPKSQFHTSAPSQVKCPNGLTECPVSELDSTTSSTHKRKGHRKKGQSKQKQEKKMRGVAVVQAPPISVPDQIEPKSFTFGEFEQLYSNSLPRCVRVIRGFYGDTSQQTISAADTFVIHFVKQATVVRVEDVDHHFYSIPLGSAVKFSLLYNPSKNDKEATNGHEFPCISDIIAADTLPKVVCATKAIAGKDQCSSIMADELLVPMQTRAAGSRNSPRELMVFSLLTKSYKVLPNDCTGYFSTKPSLLKMHISDLVSHIPHAFPSEAVMYLDGDVATQALDVSPTSRIVTILEAKTEKSLVASEAQMQEGEIDTHTLQLIEIPLEGSLSSTAEVTVIEGESRVLYESTTSLFKEFDPSKLRPWDQCTHDDSLKMQQLLSSALRTGHEKEGVELCAPTQLPCGPLTAEQLAAEYEEDMKSGYEVIDFLTPQANNSNSKEKEESYLEIQPSTVRRQGEVYLILEPSATQVPNGEGYTKLLKRNDPAFSEYEVPVTSQSSICIPATANATDQSETTSSESEDDTSSRYRSAATACPYLQLKVPTYDPYYYVNDSPNTPGQSPPDITGLHSIVQQLVQQNARLTRRLDTMEMQRSSSSKQIFRQHPLAAVESVSSHCTVPREQNNSTPHDKCEQHESESTDSEEPKADTVQQQRVHTDSTSSTGIEAPEGIKLRDLQQELGELAGWYMLGINLDIPEGILDQIHANHGYGPDGEQKCKLKMLSHWQNNADDPTWSTLVEALYTTGKKNLAKDIARKYQVPLPDPDQVPHPQTPLGLKGAVPTSRESAQLTALRGEMETKEEELHGVEQRQAQLTKDLSLLQNDLTRVTESLHFAEQFTRETLTETQMIRMELADKTKEVERLKKNSRRYKKCLQGSDSTVAAGIEMVIRENIKVQRERESELYRLKIVLEESKAKHRSALREGDKLRKHLQEVDSKLTSVTSELQKLQTQKEDLKTALQKCEKDIDGLLLSNRSTAAGAAATMDMQPTSREYYNMAAISAAKIGIKLREFEAEMLQRKLNEEDTMMELLTKELQHYSYQLEEVDESICKQKKAASSPYSEPGPQAHPTAVEVEMHTSQHLRSMLQAEHVRLRAKLAQVKQRKQNLENRAGRLQTQIEGLKQMEIEIEKNLTHFSSWMMNLPLLHPRTSSVLTKHPFPPSHTNGEHVPPPPFEGFTSTFPKRNNLHACPVDNHQFAKECSTEESQMKHTGSAECKTLWRSSGYPFSLFAQQIPESTSSTYGDKIIQKPHAQQARSGLFSEISGVEDAYDAMCSDMEDYDSDEEYVPPHDLSSGELTTDDDIFTTENTASSEFITTQPRKNGYLRQQMKQSQALQSQV